MKKRRNLPAKAIVPNFTFDELRKILSTSKDKSEKKYCNVGEY